MSSQFKPMLAGKVDLAKLKYPAIASPKLDGIRCIIKGGVALSRSLKPIPNRYVQRILGNHNLNGLDGELIVGDATAKDCYNVTQSAIMSADGEPVFTYWIFDYVSSTDGYLSRYYNVPMRGVLNKNIYWAKGRCFVQQLSQQYIYDEEKLKSYQESCLEQGFEGVMLRDPNGRYKYGRSTTKEGYLLKLKTFEDSEARIIDFIPMYHNDNVATKNILGYTERSSHQANKQQLDTLGALVVIDINSLVKFEIGTGFSNDQRKSIWDSRGNLLHSIVKYKYFPVGVKEKPRHPVFLGFRTEEDM